MHPIAQKIREATHQGDVYPGITECLGDGIALLRRESAEFVDIFLEIANVLIEDDDRGFPFFSQRTNCSYIAVLSQDESIEHTVQSQLFAFALEFSEICKSRIENDESIEAAWHFLSLFAATTELPLFKVSSSETRAVGLLLRESIGIRGPRYLDRLEQMIRQRDSVLLRALTENPESLLTGNLFARCDWFGGSPSTLLLWHYWSKQAAFPEEAANLISRIAAMFGPYSLEALKFWRLLEAIYYQSGMSDEDLEAFVGRVPRDVNVAWCSR